MIIFYQVRHHKHTEAHYPKLPCPLCGQPGGVSIVIYQRYTWWLGPMAPGPKYGLAGCDRCGQPIPNVKWTNELDSAYKALKAPLKTPPRLWRGMIVLLVIIIGLGGTGAFMLSKNGRDYQARQSLIKEYTANPKPGDIYQVIIPGKNGSSYSTYVSYSRVAGDTLFVMLMNRVNPGAQQWEGLDTEAPGAFGSEEIPLSYPMFRKDMYMTVIDNPTNYMTFWAMKRDGKLIKKF